VIAKGMKPALLALAQQRGWPLRLFGPRGLAPVAVPTIAGERRKLGTPALAEAAACSPQDRRNFSASTNGFEAGQPAPHCGLTCAEGRQSRGRHLGDCQGASQWAPAQAGTSTSLAVAQAASI